MSVALVAWASPAGGGALVLMARGFQLPTDGSMVEVPAPQGAGLHLWQGELDGGVFEGAWRRVSRRDMEEWGIPVSEPTGSPGWCCAMRQKFLVQIVADDVSVEAPVDLVDFVTSWEPTITICIRYCPFCGSQLGKDSSVRTVS